MPSKTDILQAILMAGRVFVPGVGGIEDAIEHLKHKNADPTDDADETANAVGDLIVNALLATEKLTGKDLVHDEIAAQVITNLKGDIKLLHQVLVHKPAA